ncbi:hypothetical protein HHK36_001308 [Tetracentron sinense]|uniref:Acid phosphatase/vanadium-dependent haloperoxidase-related protein n=1 Tax=Tetracentron sinense TaxID=13715 RepID=A0A835DUN5_TETSI|nr:hypothetical protein HHK36_001308 [Tetracentron sinense]
MDSIPIKPSCQISIYKHSNTIIVESLRINSFSFFKFNHFKKLNSSEISVSCRNHQNPKILKNKCNYSLPISPFWIMVSVLHSIRDFGASETQTGSFLLRNSAKKWDSYLRGFDELGKLSDGLEGDFVQSGGIGMAFIIATSNAKVRISPFVATLAANPTFVSGLVAWVIAQSMKVFLIFIMKRKWDFRNLFASGGMPSSHSALCTALTTSVALFHGVADSLFPVCLGFSLIVMYDAIGIRMHAGRQAEVLNLILEDLFQAHPISQRKLKELLGHTPSQVLSGALLGIFVACICCRGYLVTT